MTTATAIRPEITEVPQPSAEKYGEIVLQDGFTQHPHAVTEYLIDAGFKPREILYVLVLEGYRREFGQEVFPSVRTIAEKIGLQERQTRYISSKFDRLKLVLKGERYHDRAQTTNAYDLDPLYCKVAASLDPQVAMAQAEQEAKEQETFQPVDVIDETAQVLCEAYSENEPTPPEMHNSARRLHQRWSKVDQGQQSDWEDFSDLVEQALQRTKARKDEPTRTGRTFTKLVPYFFSALDWVLSNYKATQKAQTLRTISSSPNQTVNQSGQIVSQPNQTVDQSNQTVSQPNQTVNQYNQTVNQYNRGQQPKKSGPLAERAAARRAAEQAGQSKTQVPQMLALHIAAVSDTFHDQEKKSSLRRAAHLMADGGLDEQTMLQFVAEARAEASRNTQIKAKTKHGAINRMPYFFNSLERRIEAFLAQ